MPGHCARLGYASTIVPAFVTASRYSLVISGMTEVTIDTTDITDRNAWPVAVGGISNYAVVSANISESNNTVWKFIFY